jgi:hypothetical protein
MDLKVESEQGGLFIYRVARKGSMPVQRNHWQIRFGRVKNTIRFF